MCSVAGATGEGSTDAAAVTTGCTMHAADEDSQIAAGYIITKMLDAETALELQYQAEYSRILEKQEAKRLEALLAFKEKQNRQEAAGTSVGEYKRWISDDIIKSNFERYDISGADTDEDQKPEVNWERELAELRRVAVIKRGRRADLTSRLPGPSTV